MNHRNQLAGTAAGVLAAMSLLAFAPAASADGPNPDLRDGAASSAPDLGAARNDIGNVAPTPSDTGSTSAGLDTSDALIGALAGVLVAGGGIGAVATIRRRQTFVHHPA
jgi:hypothetical protein